MCIRIVFACARINCVYIAKMCVNFLLGCSLMFLQHLRVLVGECIHVCVLVQYTEDRSFIYIYIYIYTTFIHTYFTEHTYIDTHMHACTHKHSHLPCGVHHVRTTESTQAACLDTPFRHSSWTTSCALLHTLRKRRPSPHLQSVEGSVEGSVSVWEVAAAPSVWELRAV